MVGEQIENYTILRLLGEGGMAKVYLAENRETGNQIALKFLNQEYVRNIHVRNRFLAEAKNMLRLNHKNIIQVGQLLDKGDIVAFEMEYIDGKTLKEFIETRGPIQNEELTNIIIQTLDALYYVHQNRLVHRDVKPSNFMINKNGTVKLLDFGIAKNMDENSRDHTATGTHQQMGTLLYMSPEQVKSTKDVTLTSDVYSLGVVLWQLVSGKVPYDSTKSGNYDILTKIVNDPLPILNSKWDYAIQKATAKEELSRYQNCLEFKDAILNGAKPNEETKINKDSYIRNETKKKESSTTRNVIIWSLVAIFIIIVGYSLKQLGSKTKSNETQPVKQFNSTVQVNDVFTVANERAYFHNTPEHTSRRKAYLVKGEHGTVQDINGNFVYIVFTNPKNQTSRGWIRIEDITFN